MYDELAKRLKNCATQAAPCLTCGMPADGSCIETLMKQAADAIEDLIAALTASNEVIAKNKPRWIPVTERLPDDLQTVLVVRKDGGIYCWMYSACSPTDEVWVDEYANAFSVYDVTHWMPLPSTEGLDET